MLGRSVTFRHPTQRRNPNACQFGHLAAAQQVNPLECVDACQCRAACYAVQCLEIGVVSMTENYRAIHRIQIGGVTHQGTLQQGILLGRFRKPEKVGKPQLLRVTVGKPARCPVDRAEIWEEPQIAALKNAVQAHTVVQLPVTAELKHQTQMSVDIPEDGELD